MIYLLNAISRFSLEENIYVSFYVCLSYYFDTPKYTHTQCTPCCLTKWSLTLDSLTNDIDLTHIIDFKNYHKLINAHN